MTDSAPPLTVRLGSLELKNPVIAASGTFAYASELDSLVPWHKLGAVVCKGISLKPQPGNPTPRMVPTAAGMINSIGLQNMGLDRFIKEQLPRLHGRDTHVVANIFGQSIDEYVQLASCLSQQEALAALELNLSCPNVQHGRLFGRDPDSVYLLIRQVRSVAPNTPLWIKLPPDSPDLLASCKAAQKAGASALTIANTYPAMSIDLDALRPSLPRRHGGLSGPALRPIILRLVDMILDQVNIPIIACGGVCRAEDALEYLALGACAVQVGTAHFADPRSSLRMVRDLQKFLVRRGFPDMESFIGCVPRP